MAEAGLGEAQAEAQDSAGGTGQPSSVTPAGSTARSAEVVPAAETESATPETDAVLLTEPLEVSDFLVAGFTWAGDASLPEGTQIYLRVREGSQWSDWYLNESVDSGPDDVAVGGTGEFITGGADAVQAAVLGAPEDLPADLQLALVPGNPEGEQVLEDSDVDTAEADPTPVSPQSPSPGRPVPRSRSPRTAVLVRTPVRAAALRAPLTLRRSPSSQSPAPPTRREPACSLRC
ncbi:hypothetical protein [Actinomyces lilanjuaniae]|uniref:hypothetical protein n=1 Tax=Actinomyces lilanjuaniae TaxID=2321394 RepID=UPI001FA95E74|nr:hypothetical protein [Actinomyces lilanjuaniae]